MHAVTEESAALMCPLLPDALAGGGITARARDTSMI